MFDVGFTEMMVIAVVALIVIGPERLPGVARTMGHLFGRFQRYVGDVKSDIERQIELDEIKKIQAGIEESMKGVEDTVLRDVALVEDSLTAESQAITAAVAGTDAPAASPPALAETAAQPTPGAEAVAVADAGEPSAPAASKTVPIAPGVQQKAA